MSEVIVTPPRVREEQQEAEIAPDSSSTTSDSEIKSGEINTSEKSEKGEVIMNNNGIKKAVDQVVDQTVSSAQSLGKKIKSTPNWLAFIMGALTICGVLYLSGHLVWEDNSLKILSTQNYYDRGYAKGISSIEQMPWYSRVWRGFTGDYHSE